MVKLTALLDACVLYSAPLRDLLLRLATTGIFQPKWSDLIHQEWINSLLANRPDLSIERLERTRKLMDTHIENALVKGFEDLIPFLSLPDSKDRHVLAAAIKSQSDFIVTFNLNDFPTSKLFLYRITAEHPDSFILKCLEIDEESVYMAVLLQHKELKYPPVSLANLLDTFEKIGLVNTASLLRYRIL